MKTIESLLPYISYLWIVIVAATVWAYYYIKTQKRKNTLMAKRQWIETLPNLISTLGVLGTFLGISLGLICFDTNDLTKSIPQLLEGLKTAFFTSLAGMVGSLILSKRISNFYDEATGGVSDINQAAALICKAVSDLQATSMKQSNNQANFYNLVQTVIQRIDANIATLNANTDSLNVAANNMALTLTNLSDTAASTGQGVETLQNLFANISGATNSIVASVGNIEDVSNKHINVASAQLAISQESNNHLSTIVDHTEAMVSIESEVSEKTTILTDKLHGEVVDIEDKMTQTNNMLSQKFDEFSELLKKNNTEALVEVMKRVTEEFQKQMNDLISKLVQENFEQLNKSVERLNKWQMDNKEMIQSLTRQYKQMANDFEQTSTSLDRVKNDTKSLVGDGGKLDLLVRSLNEVIIKDEKFKEISSNLQKTADLSKSNMESFDKSTRQLNEWVKKQRDFSDAVSVLIKKLEEINEIRDYASTFWKETKNGMNDAVGIIQNGSENLNKQLTNLDGRFYERLSTTLAQLDACIQAIVNNYVD